MGRCHGVSSLRMSSRRRPGPLANVKQAQQSAQQWHMKAQQESDEAKAAMQQSAEVYDKAGKAQLANEKQTAAQLSAKADQLKAKAQLLAKTAWSSYAQGQEADGSAKAWYERAEQIARIAAHSVKLAR